MINGSDMVLQWYAVRFKEPRNRGRRTVLAGADYETYLGRDGQMRKRPIKGTGGRVFIAELLLQRAGFDVFLPKGHKWVRKNRISPEKKRVAFPLLANWIFVGWPNGADRWGDLLALDVVTGVAGCDGRPMLVTQDEVDQMRRRCSSGRHRAPDRQSGMRTGQEYSVGDAVKVDYGSGTGPLDGLSAVVVDVSGRNARVMVEFLGGSVPLDIDAGLVVPH